MSGVRKSSELTEPLFGVGVEFWKKKIQTNLFAPLFPVQVVAYDNWHADVPQ